MEKRSNVNWLKSYNHSKQELSKEQIGLRAVATATAVIAFSILFG